MLLKKIIKFKKSSSSKNIKEINEYDDDDNIVKKSTQDSMKLKIKMKWKWNNRSNYRNMIKTVIINSSSSSLIHTNK